MKHVTDDSFDLDVLRAERPVLVDFWAPWCGPCRAVAPILERLAGEFAGAVDIVKLNVDEAPVTAGRYRVTSIPTLAVFSGGNLVKQVAGALPEAQLRAFLEQAVPGLGPERFTPAQLEAAMKAGKVRVVDLRPAADFARHHVEGAVNAPFNADDPGSWAPPPSDGRTLVLVDKGGTLSTAVARRVGKGSPVGVLQGGILEWEISGRRLT